MGKWAYLVNAENGESTFALIDLSDEYISVMTQHYKDLQRAAAVSATEARKSRAKLMDQTTRVDRIFHADVQTIC